MINHEFTITGASTVFFRLARHLHRLIGMAAMFALLAVWVVLVEMGGAHGSEASPLMSQDACRGGATSDCR